MPKSPQPPKGGANINPSFRELGELMPSWLIATTANKRIRCKRR